MTTFFSISFLVSCPRDHGSVRTCPQKPLKSLEFRKNILDCHKSISNIWLPTNIWLVTTNQIINQWDLLEVKACDGDRHVAGQRGACVEVEVIKWDVVDIMKDEAGPVVVPQRFFEANVEENSAVEILYTILPNETLI